MSLTAAALTGLDLPVAMPVLGFLNMFGSTLVTITVLSAALLVIVVGLYDIRFLIIGSLLAYSAQMFGRDVVPPQPTLYPILAVGLVGLLCVYRNRMPRFPLLRTGVFPATFLYLALGIVFLGSSTNPGETIATIRNVLFAVVFCWGLLSACEPDEIRSGIRWTAGIVAGVSLVLVVVSPQIAIGAWGQENLANRWEGLMSNPNALAGFTSIFFLSARSLGAVLIGFLPTAVMMLGTGTRSAALGLGIVAGPQFLRNQSKLLKRVVLVVAIAVAIPLLYSVFFSEGSQVIDNSDDSLVRVTNTRADSWGTAVDTIEARPFGGLGLGNDPESEERVTVVHSSLLRPLTELGVPALLPLALIVGLALRGVRAPESPFRSIFAFMLVLGIFEGWLFAGGSWFFIVFILCSSLLSSADEPLDDADEEPAVVRRRAAVS